MRQCCPPVAKPVRQRQLHSTATVSVKSFSVGNSPSLESDWLISPGQGTQVLGCSPGLSCAFADLWRRLFLLETRHNMSFFCCSSPPLDAQTCTPVVFPCCTKLNIQPSFGILGTYLCYKAGYKFLRKVCMGENTADCVSG